MAATAFNAGDRSARMLVRAAPSADLLPSLHGMFDALAGEARLHAAMESAQPRPARPESDQRSQAAQHASLGPLDPNVLSESIAAFFIGRNAEGFWVARERSGRIGGIFVFRSSAVSFAHRQADDAACATIFPDGRFELDIENNGNRLVGLIRPLMRGVARLRGHISKRMRASQAV